VRQIKIHPYNDFRIVVGQATVALEFLTDIPDLDIIMTPIGGGGLTSGAAAFLHTLLVRSGEECSNIAQEIVSAIENVTNF
jgi:threonine dehydratase